MIRNKESDRLSIHILVSLRNRAGDEKRRQMVWDKRDNNYDWKKKIRQTSVSIASHRSFCRELEQSNVKWRSQQNTQVIALSRLFHTQTFCRPFLSAVLWRKPTDYVFLTNTNKKPSCCPAFRNNRFLKCEHGHPRKQRATPTKVKHIGVETDWACHSADHDERQWLDHGSWHRNTIANQMSSLGHMTWFS